MTCRWLLDVLAAFSGAETRSQTGHWVKDETFYEGNGPTDHSCPLPSVWGNVRWRILNHHRLILFNGLERMGSGGLHRGLGGQCRLFFPQLWLNQKGSTAVCLITGSMCIC